MSSQIHSAWDVLTLQCSEASLSASCGSQISSNGWITLAPAARATRNSLSCVSRRHEVANGRFLVVVDQPVQGALILIMQRLHENDLVGELLHPE